MRQTLTVCFLFLFLFTSLAAFAQTKVEAPAELVGHWRGLYCKAKATDQKRYGITGATYRDIGHEVSQFALRAMEPSPTGLMLPQR